MKLVVTTYSGRYIRSGAKIDEIFFDYNILDNLTDFFINGHWRYSGIASEFSARLATAWGGSLQQQGLAKRARLS